MLKPRSLRYGLVLLAFWNGLPCRYVGQELPQPVRLVDVMRVSADQPPEAAVMTLTPPEMGRGVSCDVLVVGAGTGGVAAALAAAEAGHSVCLTEETNWVGGQMTAQGVAALDENKYIETSGGTASYLKLRDAIRAYYHEHYKLSSGAARGKYFNPGSCWVSGLCFEPAAALEAIQSVLKPLQASELLRIFLRTKAVSVTRSGNRVDSVLAYNLDNDAWISFRARYVLDATETGDLLPLAGAEYVTGAEARKQTGEPHARSGDADPRDSQSFTYTFVLAHDPGQEHRISKPPDYEKHREEQPYSFSVDYGKGKTLTYRMFAKAPGTPGSFWTYRRLIAAANFVGKMVPREVSMINWPANDFYGPALLSDDADQQARALRQAKITSLGFAYWLQNDAPRDPPTRNVRPNSKRPDHRPQSEASLELPMADSKGYPDLELVTSALGSKDGLSQFPYIRESRRIKALKTVKEQDISALYQKGARAELFPDSVGIGWYPIDIHSCAKQNLSIDTKPFQIPLGALIAPKLENLLGAAKNIGTTHIASAAYRLHPVEWAIGEAAGVLADFAIDHGVTTLAIAMDPGLTQQLQLALLDRGAPLYWYDDVPVDAPFFRDAQTLALLGIFGPNKGDLHFNPSSSLTIGEAAIALSRAVGLGDVVSAKGPPQKSALDALTVLGAQGYVPGDLAGPDQLNRKLQWSDFQMACAKTGIEAPFDQGSLKPATRAAFAVWLARVYRKNSAALASPQP